KRSNMPWPWSASALEPSAPRPRPAEMTNAKALRIWVPSGCGSKAGPLPNLTNPSGKPCEQAKLLSGLHFVRGEPAVAVGIQMVEEALPGIQEFRVAAHPIAIAIVAFKQVRAAGAHGVQLLLARQRIVAVVIGLLEVAVARRLEVHHAHAGEGLR